MIRIPLFRPTRRVLLLVWWAFGQAACATQEAPIPPAPANRPVVPPVAHDEAKGEGPARGPGPSIGLASQADATSWGDLKPARQCYDWRPGRVRPRRNHATRGQATAAVGRKGGLLAVARITSVELFDSATLDWAAELWSADPACQTAQVDQLLLSDTGRFLVTAGARQNTRLWDLERGSLVHDFMDAQPVAVGDGFVMLRNGGDITRLTPAGVVSLPFPGGLVAAVSNNGARAVVEYGVRVAAEVADGAGSVEVTESFVDLSADGRRLLTHQDGHLTLWNLERGEVAWRIDEPAPHQGIALGFWGGSDGIVGLRPAPVRSTQGPVEWEFHGYSNDGEALLPTRVAMPARAHTSQLVPRSPQGWFILSNDGRWITIGRKGHRLSSERSWDSNGSPMFNVHRVSFHPTQPVLHASVRARPLAATELATEVDWYVSLMPGPTAAVGLRVDQATPESARMQPFADAAYPRATRPDQSSVEGRRVEYWNAGRGRVETTTLAKDVLVNVAPPRWVPQPEHFAFSTVDPNAGRRAPADDPCGGKVPYASLLVYLPSSEPREQAIPMPAAWAVSPMGTKLVLQACGLIMAGSLPGGTLVPLTDGSLDRRAHIQFLNETHVEVRVQDGASGALNTGGVWSLDGAKPVKLPIPGTHLVGLSRQSVVSIGARDTDPRYGAFSVWQLGESLEKVLAHEHANLSLATSDARLPYVADGHLRVANLATRRDTVLPGDPRGTHRSEVLQGPHLVTRLERADDPLRAPSVLVQLWLEGDNGFRRSHEVELAPFARGRILDGVFAAPGSNLQLVRLSDGATLTLTMAERAAYVTTVDGRVEVLSGELTHAWEGPPHGGHHAPQTTLPGTGLLQRLFGGGPLMPTAPQ